MFEKKIVPFFLIIFFCISVGAKTVQASEKDVASGFLVKPFYKEINLDKEQEEESFALTVENNSGQSAIFRITVLDFGSLDESGGVAFLGNSDQSRKYGLASWMNLEKDVIALNSGEKQEVGVKIINKESLSPGGHYGAVLLKMENDDGEGNSPEKEPRVTLNQSFASLIFVRKTGGENFGLTLKEEEFNSDFFSAPDKVNLRFQNVGNVHVTPRGIVEFFDPFGRKISAGVINPESGIILPETFRQYGVDLKDLMKAFLPGFYTAKISYRYDGMEIFSDSSHKFFLLPLAGLMILFFLMVIILAAVYILHKKKKSEIIPAIKQKIAEKLDQK